MTPGQIRQDTNKLVHHLLNLGLVIDYQDMFERKNINTEISYGTADLFTKPRRSDAYSRIYERVSEERNFNAQFRDGAFIQMRYSFLGKSLLKHRLAFLPPPEASWSDWQRDMLAEDHELNDMFKGRREGQPLRFDFDSTDDPRFHSKSHLTIGNFESCRIPVSTAITPYWFFHFILLNFYSTRKFDLVSNLPGTLRNFSTSITRAEKKVPHLVIPR